MLIELKENEAAVSREALVVNLVNILQNKRSEIQNKMTMKWDIYKLCKIFYRMTRFETRNKFKPSSSERRNDIVTSITFVRRHAWRWRINLIGSITKFVLTFNRIVLINQLYGNIEEVRYQYECLPSVLPRRRRQLQWLTAPSNEERTAIILTGAAVGFVLKSFHRTLPSFRSKNNRFYLINVMPMYTEVDVAGLRLFCTGCVLF